LVARKDANDAARRQRRRSALHRQGLEGTLSSRRAYSALLLLADYNDDDDDDNVAGWPWSPNRRCRSWYLPPEEEVDRDEAGRRR
jgi:hypothetical protein